MTLERKCWHFVEPLITIRYADPLASIVEISARASCERKPLGHLQSAKICEFILHIPSHNGRTELRPGTELKRYQLHSP